ncbi:hypothetical protein C6495_11375 [Candidatus Poribacteria bacterium]|nr:MAG: hypothetical protein C6495_11375 [Candidatus Poribacteria bacterium]
MNRYLLILRILKILKILLVLLSASHADTQIRFTDVTAEFKTLQFRHINGASGQKYFIEPLGSGVALFDFDNDADLELYFVNGGVLPGSPFSSFARRSDTSMGDVSRLPSPSASRQDKKTPPTNVLYRNDDGTFTDVTAEASVGDTGYGFGCCVGDYDNDGYRDIYVTNYGTNVLYRNNGDGTFTNVTEKAGVGGGFGLSTGCAFVDYDVDGWLDLYVVNYVQFSAEANPMCTRQGIRTYCTPEALSAEADILYRNNGDGTFTDVTKKAGIAESPGKGLGVVCGDVDNDGDVDIFVANDTTPNFLYLNDGDGTFTEDAFFAGVALSEEGRAYSGMGANLGDFDNDGYLDIVITNFQEQTNSLYQNAQDGFFDEVSFAKGIGEKSLPYLAWGVDFVDFDNDGWLDVFVANGHLDDSLSWRSSVLAQSERINETYHSTNNVTERLANDKNGEAKSVVVPNNVSERLANNRNAVGTYAQANQLFWSERATGFRASFLAEPRVYSSRGAAFGDIDNDGDVDIVVSNVNAAPTVLRNDFLSSAKRSDTLIGDVSSFDFSAFCRSQGVQIRKLICKYLFASPSASRQDRNAPGQKNVHRWLRLQLVGTHCNRDAIGARATVVAGGLTQIREVKSGSGYLSQNELHLHFGLGEAEKVEAVIVRWPCGQIDTVRAVKTNQVLVLSEK